MGYNREFEINENQVADFLQNATEKVKTTEDVDILTDLAKLFKQNVPLTVRKYVIAYMLKDSLKHYHSFGNNRHDRNDRRNNRNEYKQQRQERASAADENTEERVHHERVTIPEDQATSIFISIGKNRRVYPRDLVGILIAIAGLERDRIGDIKVLANYSFVQLYTADAPTAIEKLNGYEYRGRKLAVSYSRQKSDEENADAAEVPADETVENQADAEATEMAAEDAAAYAAAEKAAADKTPFGAN